MQLKWKLRLFFLSGAQSLNKMERRGEGEGTEGGLCDRGWQLKRQAQAERQGGGGSLFRLSWIWRSLETIFHHGVHARHRTRTFSWSHRGCLPPSLLPEGSPLCSAVPEAGVTLSTSGSLHLTPFFLHRLLCTGMWANTRPQKARAPGLLFLKEPPEAVAQPGSATSPKPSSLSHLYILHAHRTLARPES